MNRRQPHVLVLPEDDANRQIANGFLLDSSLRAERIQILSVAGGWRALLERLQRDYIRPLQIYTSRYMVLLVDFDNDLNRLEFVQKDIPSNLRSRVFVLGARKEPEDLKRANLGSYEEIGLALAKDCCEGTDTAWRHNLLQHNLGELARLREVVRPILFPFH